MRVITVCGMGFGTSLMLHVAVEGEAVDLGSYKGKPCDLIAASSEIAKQIVADVPVLSVTNLLDKKGIEEMILPYMK